MLTTKLDGKYYYLSMKISYGGQHEEILLSVAHRLCLQKKGMEKRRSVGMPMVDNIDDGHVEIVLWIGCSWSFLLQIGRFVMWLCFSCGCLLHVCCVRLCGCGCEFVKRARLSCLPLESGDF